MDEVQKGLIKHQLIFKRIIDYIIKRFAIVRYIILMPSITLLPINQAKYLDLDAPIPNDIGIESNHIGDGWDDNIYLPSAADVNFLPSPADAMILPSPTEAASSSYTQPVDVEYGVATEVARIFCIIGIIFTIES